MSANPLADMAANVGRHGPLLNATLDAMSDEQRNALAQHIRFAVARRGLADEPFEQAVVRLTSDLADRFADRLPHILLIVAAELHGFDG